MTAHWRHALKIYVSGRNRALTVEEKRSAVGADSPVVPDVPGPRSPTSDSFSAAIPVPRTLEYYRNAGIWRDRIDGGRQRKAGRGD